MSELIQQQLLQLIPGKRKKTTDWLSFNAVCCTHNQESADTRGRGGVRINADGSCNYHCFNCGFKTGYYPGRSLNFKFRKLLTWLGADAGTVQLLVVEALRMKELMPVDHVITAPAVEVTYKPRALPDDCASFDQWAAMLALTNDDYQVPAQLSQAVEYVSTRRIDLGKYEFFLTDDCSYNLDKRVIVPFYWQQQLIGYTARTWLDSVKPKYHTSHDANYVFNTDQQLPHSKFVLVVEGPFDAMAIDAVAVLHNECSDIQAEIIEGLDRDVIVIPDFDQHMLANGKSVWPGKQLIDKAIEYGWGVAFPVWREDPVCKDVSDAVTKYGKLFVLKSIIDSVEKNPVKIKLRCKQ